MNCKNVEALIPLYAGGDTDPRTTGEVQSHLSTCGQCTLLAAEYDASRNWLSGGAAPDLDEALLADLKRDVMRELRTASSRPGWFEVMRAALAQVALRPAALAVLLLAVIGTLSLWFLVPKRESQAPQRLTEDLNEQPKQKPTGSELPGSAAAPGQFAKVGRHRRVLAKNSTRGTRNQRVGPQDLTKIANAIPELQPQSALAVDSGGMLRIEMETADPSIRIIWFSPRQTENQETNP